MSGKNQPRALGKRKRSGLQKRQEQQVPQQGKIKQDGRATHSGPVSVPGQGISGEKVVKLRRKAGVVVQGCDLYIGRRWTMGGWNLPASEWMNPFTAKQSGSAQAACDHFEEWIRAQRPDLMKRLPELKGKTLGCWCKPGPCHGDVLLKLLHEADAEPEAKVRIVRVGDTGAASASASVDPVEPFSLYQVHPWLAAGADVLALQCSFLSGPELANATVVCRALTQAVTRAQETLWSAAFQHRFYHPLQDTPAPQLSGGNLYELQLPIFEEDCAGLIALDPLARLLTCGCIHSAPYPSFQRSSELDQDRKAHPEAWEGDVEDITMEEEPSLELLQARAAHGLEEVCGPLMPQWLRDQKSPLVTGSRSFRRVAQKPPSRDSGGGLVMFYDKLSKIIQQRIVAERLYPCGKHVHSDDDAEEETEDEEKDDEDEDMEPFPGLLSCWRTERMIQRNAFLHSLHEALMTNLQFCNEFQTLHSRAVLCKTIDHLPRHANWRILYQERAIAERLFTSLHYVRMQGVKETSSDDIGDGYRFWHPFYLAGPGVLSEESHAWWRQGRLPSNDTEVEMALRTLFGLRLDPLVKLDVSEVTFDLLEQMRLLAVCGADAVELFKREVARGYEGYYQISRHEEDDVEEEEAWHEVRLQLLHVADGRLLFDGVGGLTPSGWAPPAPQQSATSAQPTSQLKRRRRDKGTAASEPAVAAGGGASKREFTHRRVWQVTLTAQNSWDFTFYYTFTLTFLPSGSAYGYYGRTQSNY